MNNGTTTEAAPGRPMSSLLQGIIHDAQRLISQQLELFKIEMRQEVIRLVTGIAFVAVGAGLALVGGLLMAFFLVYLLNEALGLALWASFLIVGGVLLLAGATLAYLAYQKFASFHPIPEQSLAALKENLQWKTNLK